MEINTAEWHLRDQTKAANHNTQPKPQKLNYTSQVFYNTTDIRGYVLLQENGRMQQQDIWNFMLSL